MTGGAAARLDVWRLRFDDCLPGWAALAPDLAVLDDPERRRAAALLLPQDRRRFVVGRAFLRRVLAQYTCQAPQAVMLALGPHGKPVSKPVADGAPHLGFNLSHSRSACLVGVMRGHEVGVDLEDRRRLPDLGELMRAHLTRREQAAALATAAGARDDLFLRLWTRKEAVLKAAGAGLAAEPDQLEVRVDTVVFGGPAALGESARYRLLDLSRDAHIGAAAVRNFDGAVVIEERRLDATR